MLNTSEQSVIDIMYPNDDTKTIFDIIEIMKSVNPVTTQQTKDQLKFDFPDVSVWSF